MNNDKVATVDTTFADAVDARAARRFADLKILMLGLWVASLVTSFGMVALAYVLK